MITPEIGFPIEFTYNGFTEKELRTAFEKVEDKNNWKNPIKRQWINKDEKEIIGTAIEFFTATKMETHSESYGKLLISAPGYYAGPAN